MQNQIHTAAALGETKEIQELLSKNCELINIRDKTGNTPLYLACSQGRVATVQFLVNQGADLSITDNRGTSVFRVIIIMMSACLSDNEDVSSYYQILEILLKRRKNITTSPSNDVNDCLEFANSVFRERHPEVMRKIEQIVTRVENSANTSSIWTSVWSFCQSLRPRIAPSASMNADSESRRAKLKKE